MKKKQTIIIADKKRFMDQCIGSIQWRDERRSKPEKLIKMLLTWTFPPIYGRTALGRDPLGDIR